MISRYFPEHKLPDNVIATSDAKSALLGADYCLLAVPVQVFRVPTMFSFFPWKFCDFESVLYNLVSHYIVLIFTGNGNN